MLRFVLQKSQFSSPAKIGKRSLLILVCYLCTLFTTSLAGTTSPVAAATLSPQDLTAKAAIAIDADSGRVLFTKNPDLPLPMASTTKIMTALTFFAIPGTSLDDYTTIVQNDLVGEANMGLVEGQRIKLIYLLYGMLLNSANDASAALARYAGAKLPATGLTPYQSFIAEMNRMAVKLGLKNTHFVNSYGLDADGHYSSARDLATMGWYLLQNPTLAAIVRLSQPKLDGYDFYNISNFIRRYPGATGIKPGETDNAGLCLVASATQNGRNALVVLLNSPGLKTESDRLMDYAFAQAAGTNQTIGDTGKQSSDYLDIPYRFGSGHFHAVWNRTDMPIAMGSVSRSWYWGPKPLASFYETYADSPGQQRLIQYFDKARMEINDPAKGTVTNGLLVVEMITGRRQDGDTRFIQLGAATIPVAGDPGNSGPTYASLGQLYQQSRNLPVGQAITASWNGRAEDVQNFYRDDPATKIATSQNGLGIPAAFWDFVNQKGPVLLDTVIRDEPVSNWLFSTGYPITEAYWTKVKVGGVEKDVMFQAFERRLLTYCPSNPPGYQVEMGNVGLHYLAWRYPPSRGGEGLVPVPLARTDLN